MNDRNKCVLIHIHGRICIAAHPENVYGQWSMGNRIAYALPYVCCFFSSFLLLGLFLFLIFCLNERRGNS